MSRHSDIVYLQHIRDYAQEAIDLFKEFQAGRIEHQRVVQLALIYLIEVVGEAASKVTQETKSQLPEVPWRQMVDMRNKVIHGYDSVEFPYVEAVITNHLPVLLQAINAFILDKGEATFQERVEPS